jgi:hypothetical protein
MEELSSWFSRNMILSGSVILAFWDCIFWLLGTRNGLQVRWSESIGFYKILPRTSGEIWSPVRTAIYCVICSFVLTLVAWFQFFNAVSWFQ